MTLTQKYNFFKLALKYWPISANKLKHWFNKKNKHQPNFPALVRFFLFYGCNLKCQMCGQWGECGTSQREEIKKFLPLQKLKSLADEIAPHHSEIYLWGGEPTLHPDFKDFIKYLKQKKLIVTLNTNGILLSKYAPDLISNKIDSLDISLLGPSEIHDKIVGVPNSFATVMQGLKILYAEGTACGFKPLVKAIITLNASNIHSIEDLLNLNEKNPAIDLSIIQLGWFITEERGLIYEQRMRQDFNLSAASWQGFLADFNSTYVSTIESLIKKIRANKNYHKPILFFPNLKNQDIAAYYLDHKNNFAYQRCAALDREIDIRHNGEVVICADYPDYVIGDLNQASIVQIWHGEKLAAFKKNIQEKGLLTICSRCCGLFR